VRLQEYGHPVSRFEGGAEEPDWAAQSTAAIASVCVQGRPGVVPDPCFKERKKGRKPVMPGNLENGNARVQRQCSRRDNDFAAGSFPGWLPAFDIER
jgi:hypothetical protein